MSSARTPQGRPEPDLCPHPKPRRVLHTTRGTARTARTGHLPDGVVGLRIAETGTRNPDVVLALVEETSSVELDHCRHIHAGSPAPIIVVAHTLTQCPHAEAARPDLGVVRSPSGAPELTRREIAILRLLADGRTLAEISRELRYSERTIKNDLHKTMGRLNSKTRVQAVAWAVRAGVI